MKRFLFVALWVMAATSICACGEDDQWSKLKDRCLEYNETLEHCFVDPADYQRSVSACDAFNKASTGEEYKDFFLCKEECVNNASAGTECNCLLAPEHGGPDC
jgi:hypothetical protein